MFQAAGWVLYVAAQYRFNWVDPITYFDCVRQPDHMFHSDRVPLGPGIPVFVGIDDILPWE